MIEKTGNLLLEHEGIIGHGVNCMGLMGAGIAASIRDMFPEVYHEYWLKCEEHKLEPGDCLTVKTQGTNAITHVANMATQFRPGADATYPALLHSLLMGARDATIKGYNRMGIPWIGCGIGGLEIPPVERYIGLVERMVPGLEFVVYTLPPKGTN